MPNSRALTGYVMEAPGGLVGGSAHGNLQKEDLVDLGPAVRVSRARLVGLPQDPVHW